MQDRIATYHTTDIIDSEATFTDVAAPTRGATALLVRKSFITFAAHEPQRPPARLAKFLGRVFGINGEVFSAALAVASTVIAKHKGRAIAVTATMVVGGVDD
jgi:hypothetical protein